MIYGIISDIHGNLEALQAVLEYLESYEKKIDKIICLGDIVGYGADPGECIRLTKEISDVILAGNHDFAVSEQTSVEDFNHYAKEAVLWSRDALNEEELDFLKKLPLIYRDNGTDFVHSSLHRPESWRYLLGTPDTYIDFQIMEEKILFVGHTHVPVIFEDDGTQIKILTSTEVSLNVDKKYIINVGSVGQPRDRDPRASFVIFDLEENFVKRIRVDYDIKEAQRKILDAGLPEVLANRLSYGG
jgi:diadenosine tetraphosphatase ApaH/serine/threonine PP2A family protein phosphatase